jgi:8-oxo-dGTP diphosphatase/2-hydroxy-dATP diphosphatase
MPSTAKKILTLCLLRKDGRILLGMKKRGFGANRWNGFGGKVEAGETIEQGARRELLEESGLTATAMEQVGLVTFTFAEDPVAMEVHVFRVDDWHGEPAETEEMRPRWFAEDAIPFDAMWPDDKYWFPLFLSGKKFKGEFAFVGEEVITAYDLREFEELTAYPA